MKDINFEGILKVAETNPDGSIRIIIGSEDLTEKIKAMDGEKVRVTFEELV